MNFNKPHLTLYDDIIIIKKYSIGISFIVIQKYKKIPNTTLDEKYIKNFNLSCEVESFRFRNNNSVGLNFDNIFSDEIF